MSRECVLRATQTPAEADEPVLMARLREGEVVALEELYEQYSRRVYTVALRVLGDHEAAEEVTLDVFHELWSRPDRYDRGRGRVVTYLMLLTRSRAVDRKRQHHRRWQLGRASQCLERVPELVCEEPAPVERIELNERRAQIHAALEQLQPMFREPVKLSFLEGLTQKEIARRLRIPLGTLRTRIHRGLIRLRCLLDRGAMTGWAQSYESGKVGA